MKNKHMLQFKNMALVLLLTLAVLHSCDEKVAKYEIGRMEGGSVTIDKKMDAHLWDSAVMVLDKYYSQAHAIMSDTIGYSDMVMKKNGKENLIGNFTSDALLAIGKDMFPSLNIDMSLMNLGGIRIDMPKGFITVGDIFAIYPFDNNITVISLKGKDVRTLFDGFASRDNFEAFSGAKVVVKDKKIEKLTINGKPVSDEKVYYIVTIDFVAEGNDNMRVLQNALSRTDSDVKERDAFVDYVKKLTGEGRHLSAKIDGRIVEH